MTDEERSLSRRKVDVLSSILASNGCGAVDADTQDFLVAFQDAMPMSSAGDQRLAARLEGLLASEPWRGRETPEAWDLRMQRAMAVLTIWDQMASGELAVMKSSIFRSPDVNYTGLMERVVDAGSDFAVETPGFRPPGMDFDGVTDRTRTPPAAPGRRTAGPGNIPDPRTGGMDGRGG